VFDTLLGLCGAKSNGVRPVPAAILDEALLYDGWNRLLMVKARTAGGAVIHRSVEDHGDAVTVLPFDPERRVALMVRQLRVAILRGHGVPASTEAPAGILDEDDPAACARREAMEEAGLELKELVPLGFAYVMPGVSTERMHMFLAEYSAANRVAAGGGLAEENEEIEVLEVGLGELARMADAGELTDLKTYALIQSLRLKRPELF
jgi:nudix-type nucleoside diphosphatase (YffH/AdpP family)